MEPEKITRRREEEEEEEKTEGPESTWGAWEEGGGRRGREETEGPESTWGAWEERVAKWRASWDRATATHPDPRPSKKVRTGTLGEEK